MVGADQGPGDSAASIDAAGISFVYPDGRKVLDNVDLSVEPGQRVAVLGPNGAGKTTFSLLLNGLLTPTSGHIRIGPLPVVDEHLATIRRQVGMLFQHPDDQLFLPTVEQDVAFGPSNLGLDPVELKRRVDTALGMVDGEPFRSRSPHHLSDGEKRRIAVATVLAMEPEILVLDEPTVGLDPAGRRELIALLSWLPQTQLVITHDLPLALELCPRAVIVDKGQVVADGSTIEIFRNERLLAAHRLELPYGFTLTEPDSTEPEALDLTDFTLTEPDGVAPDPNRVHR